jgi:hypothetical protein
MSRPFIDTAQIRDKYGSKMLSPGGNPAISFSKLGGVMDENCCEPFDFT